MTDEKNDPVGRDENDQERDGQTPPPLIPPPVRRPDTGEQPYAERSRAAGADEPVFVEPDTARRDGAPVFSDRDDERVDADDAADREGTRDERPADPAYEERPLDQTAAVPVSSDAVSASRAQGDRRDDDRFAPRRDDSIDETDAAPRDLGDNDDDAVDDSDRADRVGVAESAAYRESDTQRSARDVVADRQAAQETAAEAETVTVAHPSTAPDAAPSPVFVPPAQGGYEQTAAYPPAPAVQREFVEPPVEPKKKGNRGVGVLIAVLSVILFAIIYCLIAAAIIGSQRPQDLGDIFLAFAKSPVFLVPTIIFVVAFIIVVLLANRASWWAYVLGSLLVGALVYFGTIGVALILANPTTLTPDDARRLITERALDPFLITAALVAREVSLWTGAAIASRGRRMKARNLTAREEYERASAEHRAEYERSYPTAG